MKNNEEMLGTAPIGKLLFKLAIPTVTAQVINMLYNIVDRIYIGHMPGDGSLALTGVGICLPLLMIVSAFAALVGFGGAPRASIFMGKKDKESAEKTLGGCFTTQIVISALLMIVLFVFSKPLLYAFGASDNTIGYAVDYITIYAIGTLFVQLTLGMNAFITAQGFTTVSMVAVLIGAISNIILDPIFIFALKLGVKGAAAATVISQFISCVFVVGFLLSKKTILKLKLKNLFVSPKIVLPCLALGMSAFVMQASESIISVCFNSSLLKYGGDIAVGAMTIMTSVMQFAMLPLQGIGQGAQPISSYNYGAGNKERVKKTFKLLLISSLTYSVLLWILVMAMPRIFASMFTPDQALLDYCEKQMRIFFGGLLLFGVQMACQMTFVSLGYAGSSIIVAVVRKFVLLLPLIYIMPEIVANKAQGIYMAEPIADIIAVTFTAILFTIEFKRALKKMDNNDKGTPTGGNEPPKLDDEKLSESVPQPCDNAI